jgi:nucleoside-diphosphate-sugar epimerase
MHKVLVTGASGFLGRHCLPLLISKGYEVHALSRRPAAMEAPGVSWHEGDLLRPGCASGLIGELRPDSLLHLAWCVAPGKFWEALENVEWLRASLEMLSAFTASGGKRIVGAGSGAEYDGSGGECKEDSTRLLPATLYGTSKHALERIIHSLGWRTGLSSAWGRIFCLYGPHEYPSRLVASVVQSLLRGEPALCSEGTQVRDFLHVEDVAAAFVALLESEVQGAVNIGSGDPVTVKNLIEEIGRQTGRPELLRFGARDASGEPLRVWANVERLANEVGWAPRYDLKDGIRQTIEWWRSSMRVSPPTVISRSQEMSPSRP